MCKCEMVEIPTLGIYAERKELYPVYATRGAAAMDLRSKDTVIIPPGKIVIIKTGVYLDIPEGYDVDLRLRSSMSAKRGLVIANGVGTIDQDYVDEVGVIVYNTTEFNVAIDKNERVAQIMLVKKQHCNNFILNEKPQKKGDRDGGFGHTGTI